MHITELEKKKKKDLAPTGLAHMYRQLLEESDQRHKAAVTATQKPVIGPMPNLTITKPPDFVPKSDLELATIARALGRDVELNDDNQIVDKRELLAPGLNLSAPNTRMLGLRTSTAASTSAATQAQTHRAAGTAASWKEIQERRTREILSQMEEEKKRTMEDKARMEEETTRRIASRRNTEGDVQSARDRYLQRKRQRLEAVEDPLGIP